MLADLFASQTTLLAAKTGCRSNSNTNSLRLTWYYVLS